MPASWRFLARLSPVQLWEAPMKPVILLVGRLPGVDETVARELQDLPVEWLGAHDRAEVERQLDTEPAIACVVMGIVTLSR